MINTFKFYIFFLKIELKCILKKQNKHLQYFPFGYTSVKLTNHKKEASKKNVYKRKPIDSVDL